MGGDSDLWQVEISLNHFNPHHPCGWWRIFLLVVNLYCYFNPHHPCGWWQDANKLAVAGYTISIHTTHVGGDTQLAAGLTARVGFQSTPPVWVVTVCFCINRSYTDNFNPHHPCGWWQKIMNAEIHYTNISIHTTRVGGDTRAIITITSRINFNPHHPCGWWL